MAHSAEVASMCVSRRTLVAGVFAACCPIPARAQLGSTISIPAGAACFDGARSTNVPTTVFSFESSDEARTVVRSIVTAIGLQPNFTIMAAAVPNAAAIVSEGNRLVVYNEVWLQGFLGQRGNKRWAGIGLLAHEVGHHLNGHTLDGQGSRPPKEIDADYFAGFVIRKMGGSAADARACFELLSETASATHPARADRLQAATVGWRKGGEGSGGSASPSPSPDTPRSRPIEREFDYSTLCSKPGTRWDRSYSGLRRQYYDQRLERYYYKNPRNSLWFYENGEPRTCGSL